MQKIGFFGGSFNPITKAHVNLVQDIINKYKLDKIVFVPVGDYYEKEELINEKHRFNMIRMLVSKFPKLEVSDIELNHKEKIFAKDIFKMLKSIYYEDDIYFIIGADNLYKMTSWLNLEELVQYNYIIIERDNIHCDSIINTNSIIKKNKTNFKIINNRKYNNFSSTLVRNKIKQNDIDDITNYIFEETYKYIKENELYIR